MKLFKFIVLFNISCLCYGQVKIGDNISTIDAASLLELDSETRAFVPTRITNGQMEAMSPLKGALVYNTDLDCIFIFDGAVWKSLCNSGMLVSTSAVVPASNEAGDVWINDITHQVYIWNGFEWILINANLKNGTGEPTATMVDNIVAGDIYVDRSNGRIFAFDGAKWRQSGGAEGANGLHISDANTLELGGPLSHPTIISTDTTNTLAIAGLTEVTADTADLVVVDKNTGQLHSASPSSFLQRQESIITAVDGQREFITPLSITDANKITVYRNGIKIDFVALDDARIEVEAQAVCYDNDEIRIVQFL